MITFGLTGGIACGKSTVTKIIKSYNIPVIDADIIARQVVELGSSGLNQIVDSFGYDYLNDNCTLNRSKFGKFVFENPSELAKLDRIMKPLIEAESTKQLNVLRDEGHKVAVYDAALIIEMGNADKYRPLILVHCGREDQISRLIKRNSLTEAEAVARIDSQMPSWQKISYVDHIIYTSGYIEFSVYQTKNLIEKYMLK